MVTFPQSTRHVRDTSLQLMAMWRAQHGADNDAGHAQAAPAGADLATAPEARAREDGAGAAGWALAPDDTDGLGVVSVMPGPALAHKRGAACCSDSKVARGSFMGLMLTARDRAGERFADATVVAQSNMFILTAFEPTGKWAGATAPPPTCGP